MNNFHVKFTAKNLTGNAGLVHFGKFAEKLKLPQTLKKVISIKRGHTANYEVADVVMILMMGVLSGIKHISNLDILRHDSVIRKLFDWKQFPDNRTFGRLFKLFNHKHCNELHEVEKISREKVWSKKWFRGKSFFQKHLTRKSRYIRFRLNSYRRAWFTTRNG